jgi:glucose/arabinose dehydrogenase
VVPYGTAQTLQRLQGTQDAAGWSYDLTAAYPQTFDQAVDLRCPGDSRLFVVEQSGRIRVFDTAGSAEPTTFLDLRDVVTSGGELGLLGLAFPPDYATRGQFFVYYTVGSGPWTAQLCRFDVSADPNVADRASEKLLLSIDEPYSNHNGGSLAFDADGMLLLGVGDGGSGGDPDGHGQDPLDLHGAILRLDVLGVDASPWYRIPDDNPFALGRSEFAPEVFAFGLRNPWRMSVDPLTGDIWCGDVGQSRYEEIDLITAGANYGWDCREGAHPYTGPPGEPSSACSQNTD